MFEFRFCNFKFFWIQATQKLGYDCLCEWVGVGITSPVPKMEGNFQSKRFMSLGTESGMVCVGVGSAAGKTEKGWV
jgi:hypothetical protein